MSKEKYYFSKSLEKGLKILALFNGQTPALTQSVIAKMLGLNMTSTYRYINTLVELGYLDKDKKTREIRPSILCTLFCTNLMRATDHLRLIKEVVDRIHAEHNISIDVIFTVDDTMVRIYNRSAEETLTYSLPDTSKNCLHNTALGKAYLCSLPEDQIAEKIDKMELAPKTKNTIIDKAELAGDLKKSQARGFAMNNEEYLPGLIAIGAPLYDPISNKGVGAVCFDFSVIQHNAGEIKAKYGDMIQATARSLSVLLPPDKTRN
jgi:DNA-binding IclR family transcriptional regulator